MSDKKYVVPRKMWNAAHEAHCQYNGGAASDGSLTGTILQAAIRWIAENPIVPTDTDVIALTDVAYAAGSDRNRVVTAVAQDWQRRMFLAPEPEVPDAVKDFLWGDWERSHGVPGAANGWLPIESHNAQVLAAYNRGKSGK